MHFVYACERDSLYADERVAEWMRRSGVGIIRWPGGTAVQHYHWENLSGVAFEDSWDPAFDRKRAPPSDYMDLDEYVAFCRRVGAEPMVGVNTKSGKRFKRMDESVAEARRLIKYCVDKGYAVKHWYIGNECFIGWSAAAYAKSIDRYAEVLKSVDPDITIVGDWKFGPERKRRFEQTLSIALASKHIDVMEVHEKWGNKWGLAGEGGHTVAEWQREAGVYDGKLKRYIERFLEKMRAAGKDVRLGFNEWGATVTDGTPFHVALVKADYLVELFRHPVYSACDWNLNMGPGKSRILVTGDKGRRLEGFSPAARVFEMCAHALGRTHVPMTSSARDVYGFAAVGEGPGTLQVYVLNKRSDAVALELDLDGGPAAGAALEIESFVEPGATVRSAAASGCVVRVEGLSFNRIEVRVR
jgi:hypothetical protein